MSEKKKVFYVSVIVDGEAGDISGYVYDDIIPLNVPFIVHPNKDVETDEVTIINPTKVSIIKVKRLREG